VRAALIEAARRQETVRTLELLDLVDSSSRGEYGSLVRALEDIFMEDVRLERPLLISLIRDERARAYDPYNDRARSLGLLTYDEDAFFFWQRQRESVCEFWQV
jgi:hypothetical protein